jgi:hypothetical protein
MQTHLFCIGAASGMSDVVEHTLAYAYSLRGMRYATTTCRPPPGDGSPFWPVDGPPPEVSLLQKIGACCCAGFINLVRRNAGLPVPQGTGDAWPGGTMAWWQAFADDKLRILQTGALLLRKWRSDDDPGHVAIVYHVIDQSHVAILHCHPDAGMVECELVTTECVSAYYDRSVAPHIWLHTHAPS